MRWSVFRHFRADPTRWRNFLSSLGIGRGERVLIMLGNVVPLWETMLAAMKLGAVMIPASTLLRRRAGRSIGTR